LQRSEKPGNMTIDDAARLRLYESARRTLGPEEADTLMASLPPSHWDRLATKDDLAHLATKMELADLRAEMADRFEKQTRTFVVSLVASQATLVGMVLAAVRLGI
jgi:hypothetical protein